MRLQGVDAHLRLHGQGKPGTSTVTRTSASTTPTQQKAVFRGHVVVTTETASS